ncbi:hypothetical protein Acsp05_01290 [Actinokineospora sp. NBRC 105648]|nr:hypothetical protein Acsp05_01290 [Actinokineospora sp. NBRC 105648]
MVTIGRHQVVNYRRRNRLPRPPKPRVGSRPDNNAAVRVAMRRGIATPAKSNTHALFFAAFHHRRAPVGRETGLRAAGAAATFRSSVRRERGWENR